MICTGDECDRCGRQIQFVASRSDSEPTKQFCSDECRDRHQRDSAIWAASRNGETVAEIGARFDMRREKVTQIITMQRAREEAAQAPGKSDRL